MQVCHKGLTICLRAFKKEDIPVLVEHFSSMKIHLYTKGVFAQTLENELEWYEKNRKDPDSCTWAIVPNGAEKPIGVTSLHRINAFDNSCTSGIIIWDADWWGQGVAGATHIARTYWAACEHNRFVIKSSVRVKNEASRRALERVGYTVWGTEPLTAIRRGERLATHHLIWIHPEHANDLFPEGVPEIFLPGIEKARATLELAKYVVTFP